MTKQIRTTTRVIIAVLLASWISSCGSNNSGSGTITFFNSDMEEISELMPLDVLYIGGSGFNSNTYYAVSVQDPRGNDISKFEMPTDSEGKLAITPLWYESGLKKPSAAIPFPFLDQPETLSALSFTVRVKRLPENADVLSKPLHFQSFDFTQRSKPRPIVMAGYQDGPQFIIENAFEETGSRTATGLPSLKTSVYVDALLIPWFAGETEVTAVDIYIVPFDGEKLKEGAPIATEAVIVKTGVPVVSYLGVTKKLAAPQLVWDLNNPATPLVNPDGTTCVYRVVIDVDRNGVFNYGADVNSDGKTEAYVDGIDGNSEPGFIVLNTPANQTFASLKNGNTPDSARTNELYEASSGLAEELFLWMDNIPTTRSTVDIYVIDAITSPVDGTPLTDVRGNPAPESSTATVTFPGVDDLRIMPYIAGAPVINTSLGDARSYGANIGTDKAFSIVIDLNANGLFDATADIHLSGEAQSPTRIHVLTEPASIDTFASQAGTQPTWAFDETGSNTEYTVVWAEVSGTLSADVTLALFQHTTWADGDSLEEALLSTTYTDGDSRYKFWDLDETVQVKNPDSTSGTFDIVVDYGNDGLFHSGTDLILTVTIRDTAANDYPRVQYANVASDGHFSNGDYGYKDSFLTTCEDTHSSSYVSRGIKGIWNPYIKQYNTAEDDATRTLYQGNYVDIYIVDTNTVSLNEWESCLLTDAIDATGRHKTLPVQYSCGNGAGMQNIWTPTLTPGSYYVIIDVNQNGQIDEGVDIIDAMNTDEKTIQDDPSVVGFEVTE